MSNLAAALDRLVADAPTGAESWEDVLARAGVRQRDGIRKKPIALTLVAAAVLGLAGTAVGVGVDLLTQQAEFHAKLPNDPERIGPLVEVTSGDDWALIAWRSSNGICLDFAIPGNSPFDCDFPVRGAKPPTNTTGAGPPTHAVGGFVIGGGLVGGDDKTTIMGVAASGVAKVTIELTDGRVLGAPLYSAPDQLHSDLRFFVVRLWLPAAGGTGSPVRAYAAYDSAGNLIESVRD